MFIIVKVQTHFSTCFPSGGPVRVRVHGDGCVLDNRSGSSLGHVPHPCVRLPHPGDPVHRGAVPRVHEGLEP